MAQVQEVRRELLLGSGRWADTMSEAVGLRAAIDNERLIRSVKLLGS